MSATAPAQTLVPVRRPVDLRAALLMLALCLVWGSQQVVIKKVAGDIAPIMQLVLRFALAAVFFAAVVVVREGWRSFADGSLRSGLALGALFSLEFLLVGESLNYTTAAHSVVFLYTSPIFTALGMRFLPEEHLSRGQWIGIGVAFAGIAVAFLGGGLHLAPRLLLGDAFALLGGIAWGLSNVALRRGRIGNSSTAKTVLYQVGLAAALLWGFAALTHQDHVTLSRAAVVSITFQTLVVSIASYLVWFWMLRRYLTSRLMMISFVTPLVGVLFGAWMLGEPIEADFAAGSVLVIAGVAIVNAPRNLSRARRSRSA